MWQMLALDNRKRHLALIKRTGDQHYKETYNNQKEINFDQLSWFSKVEPPKVAYNMNVFKPLDIRKALGKN